jgi:3-dehydroquinate synthase
MSEIKPPPITVELGERSYPLYVGSGIIQSCGRIIEGASPDGKYVIVTDKEINRLHGGELGKSLETAGIEAETIRVPEGEEAKTWEEAERLIGEFLEMGLDRSSTLIAFGGGTIGDVAGFVAAIFLRGINLIQVPTTFLAQVDSSVGGKTAVNHPKGKNLIGAFKQPLLVISDPALLETLPRREIRSGLGEVVKYGVISDRGLFQYLEEHGKEILDADLGVLEEVVRQCVEIKAGYVSRDERDVKGVRAALNYGHTLGHALEIITEMELSHGEAVALGMVYASRVAEEMGLIDKGVRERQEYLLRELGLETQLPKLDPAEAMDIMHRDKKAEGRMIRLVLPTGIGRPPVLRRIREDTLLDALVDEG